MIESPNNFSFSNIIFKKIISYKNLKHITLDLHSINDYEIGLIEEVNKTLTALTINWKGGDDCILYNLQNKFENLSNLEIINNSLEKYPGIFIEIKENKKCKVNSFKLLCHNFKNIKFYCQPFENIIEIDLHIEETIRNIYYFLPLFNYKCNKIFNSLIKFRFENFYGKI